MSLYRRSMREVCEQAEADQEREYPTCKVDGCNGRKGIDCPGHCVEEGCAGTPVESEDYCAACIARINAEPAAVAS